MAIGDDVARRRALIWALVMASRGLQLVADGVLSESDRATAEHDYRDWVLNEATTQSM